MICKLCRKEKDLCKSHIIPEFFYRHLYDEKGRFLVIPMSKGEKTLFKQNGVYEKLLCKDCEQHINKYEKITKRLFFDEMQYQDMREQNLIRVINLNYDMIKLFQLSLLWRASVSTDAFFSEVNLGKHEEHIRQMIINDNPGEEYEYGCAQFGLFLDKNESFDLIMRPERMRIEGHICCRFVISGYAYLFFVSSHTLSYSLKHHFLRKNGTITVKFFPAKQVPFIREMAQELVASGNLNSGKNS